jgi:magnesium-transporting ATPase (P-type)
MKKTNSFLISPRFGKFCVISAVTLWTSTIVMGLLLAQLDQAGPGYDLAKFNPGINYISDLGSSLFTPLPTILTFGMMGTSLLLIPISITIRKLIISEEIKRSRKIFGDVTFVILIIGIFGFFLTGVLSEETGKLMDQIIGYPIDSYPWHRFVADIAFGFLMISGLLISIEFVMFKDILEKKIEVKNPRMTRVLLIIDTGILAPIFFGFFHASPYVSSVDTPFWDYLPIWKWKPLWEWLLMFCVVGFLFSVSLMLIKPFNRKIIKEIEKS